MNKEPASAIVIEDVPRRRGGRGIPDRRSGGVPAGQVAAVLGPSGAGKTTRMRLALGQLRPDSGQVWLGDVRVGTLSAREPGRLRRDTGVLLQSGALFTDLTVFDNVALPVREHTGLPESLIARLVLMKLEMVGLRGTANLYPAELSGAMRRRVATARAIALDPDIMFSDDHFAELDPISLGVSLRLIRDINAALGTTSIVITHDVGEIAKLADHAIIIANRRLMASGSPAELAGSTDALVRQFVQGEP